MPEHRVDPTALIEARRDLTADCSRCLGLCCVGPAFAASADFAIDKPAGTACPHLLTDSRCGIHDRLRDRGFPGCVVFDCFGAGQRVTQDVLGGRDWRADPATAATTFAVFAVMRQLTEMLWHLAEAVALTPAGSLGAAVSEASERIRLLVRAPAGDLVRLDAAALRGEVGVLLGRVSDAVRRDVPDRARDRAGADLVAARLRGADLHGASLRGALLIGADLRGADLRRTDLLGADLRGADLRGANLSGSLFLTQPQLTAAIGDAGTALPPSLVRPVHWSPERAAVAGPPAERRPARGPAEGNMRRRATPRRPT